jgi:hypothetical protein
MRSSFTFCTLIACRHFIKVFVVVLANVVLPGISDAQRELTPRDVIAAGFGDGVRDYGSSKVPALKKLEDITVVSCYAVTDERIFVCDFFRSEVKCYTRGGEYLSTMRVEAHGGPVDMAVVRLRSTSEPAVIKPTLVMLHDSPITPVDPSIEWSRFQLFIYDIDSGSQMSHVFLHCDDAGFSSEGHPYGRAVFLHADDMTLGLVDFKKQSTFPVFSDGALLAVSAQALPVRGWGGKSRLVAESTSMTVLDDEGRSTRVLKTGTPVAVAADGSQFAVAELGDDEVAVSICSSQGQVIGIARRPLKPYATELTLAICNQHRIIDDILFEVRVDDAGVHVIEWR